jgi:hypothetical protein
VHLKYNLASPLDLPENLGLIHTRESDDEYGRAMEDTWWM